MEIENCQTAVRLGRGKTISKGMRNNVSDGGCCFSRASECLCVKERQCLLPSPFVKGGTKKGGMRYLKGSTRNPSLPTCSAPALMLA